VTEIKTPPIETDDGHTIFTASHSWSDVARWVADDVATEDFLDALAEELPDHPHKGPLCDALLEAMAELTAMGMDAQ